VAMAARGMPSYLALSGVWAKARPPCVLISRSPSAPSEAVQVGVRIARVDRLFRGPPLP
jgi:hypothetical protein